MLLLLSMVVRVLYLVFAVSAVLSWWLLGRQRAWRKLGTLFGLYLLLAVLSHVLVQRFGAFDGGNITSYTWLDNAGFIALPLIALITLVYQIVIVRQNWLTKKAA